VVNGRSVAPPQTLASARQAIAFDERGAEAHAVLGMVTLFMRRYDESERRLQTAVTLTPNLAFAFMLGGGFYALSARAERRTTS
jgi:adenylate cyclase